MPENVFYSLVVTTVLHPSNAPTHREQSRLGVVDQIGTYHLEKLNNSDTE